ncbi:hypothetical protein [Streptomyces canus]|uniref:hypothetical protein n=1 Tax=Streptomyces canus TaxID=58343 RepID=UPI00278A72A9|nr:hypothetical protein [Streptomyces canus]MDQ0758169.1 hypothetical protein [Streptomyces canus]MDQ1073072.1 hypothetical protein [Streptomyces canus]
MKAALLTAPARMETIHDWAAPVFGPGDVIVEAHGVGQRGRDLAVFHDMRVPPSTPCVLGHEGFPLARAQEAFAGAAGRAGKTWIDVGSEYAQNLGSEYA